MLSVKVWLRLSLREVLDIRHLTHYVAYMDVYIYILLPHFWSPFGLFQQKQTNSLFYKSLNLVLVYR